MPRRPALAIAAFVALQTGCSSTAYREIEVDLGDASPSASQHHEVVGSEPTGGLRFSVAAMQSPESTYASYSQLFARVGELVGIPIHLVQRRTYREVNDQLLSGDIHAALVCTGGYLDLRRRAPGATEAIAVPVVNGKTTYRSFVIVPASSTIDDIDDLEGRSFAFTDDLSLTGRAYAVSMLRELGREPSTFFATTPFTHSHDRSIAAVASGLVDGASVDSLVYDSLQIREPELIAKTRVIHRSPELAIGPVLVSSRVPEATRARLGRALLGLHRGEQATSLLDAAEIDWFAAPRPGSYDSAAAIFERSR